MHVVKENKGSNCSRGAEHMGRKKKREKLSQTLTKEGAKESSELDLHCNKYVVLRVIPVLRKLIACAFRVGNRLHENLDSLEIVLHVKMWKYKVLLWP